MSHPPAPAAPETGPQTDHRRSPRESALVRAALGQPVPHTPVTKPTFHSKPGELSTELEKGSGGSLASAGALHEADAQAS